MEKKGLMILVGGPKEPDGDEHPKRIGHYEDSVESAAADQQSKEMIRAVGTKLRAAIHSDDDLALGHAIMQAVQAAESLGDCEE